MDLILVIAAVLLLLVVCVVITIVYRRRRRTREKIRSPNTMIVKDEDTEKTETKFEDVETRVDKSAKDTEDIMPALGEAPQPLPMEDQTQETSQKTSQNLMDLLTKADNHGTASDVEPVEAE